ncbi:GNAT family N-acetyltransferase [Photobacterium sanguinicancri]|uniref:GNAT family N-acetyltransferase n=1 Tax=Photobacterium sanguinicancri TaxID=875932 RepID=UPI0026E1561F|nr:GNAT family N-acetyltransferase [Photobacterium sanguinicancri]MDO6501206.1 GNAT family N-acetyltransferase [Photobacterium sanguinicancri]
MEIIRTTHIDRSVVWSIFVPAMRHHIEKIWGWDINWQTNEFESRYFELNTSFIVKSGKRVGYIQYELRGDSTYLNMLVIRPEFQGQNLGVEVLETVLGFQYGKQLELRCFKVNPRAIKFYINQGFEQVGEEEHFVVLRRDVA